MFNHIIHSKKSVSAVKVLGLCAAVVSLSACMTLAKKQQLALQQSWEMQSIDGVEVVSAADITFSPDGSVSGLAGCNRFTASASPRGDHVNLSPLAMTKMTCSGEKMQQEQTFLQALERVKHFLVKDGKMYFTDEQDIAVIAFTPK